MQVSGVELGRDVRVFCADAGSATGAIGVSVGGGAGSESNRFMMLLDFVVSQYMEEGLLCASALMVVSSSSILQKGDEGRPVGKGNGGRPVEGMEKTR